MYPGSLPLIFNGSVPGHEKLFNVRRCSMYTGVQFDRFHCIYKVTCHLWCCLVMKCKYKNIQHSNMLSISMYIQTANTQLKEIAYMAK